MITDWKLDFMAKALLEHLWTERKESVLIALDLIKCYYKEEKPLIKQGGVFKKIEDKDIFKNTLTILNGTVAWDIDGNRNEYECIDIDPMTLFECPSISEIPES